MMSLTYMSIVLFCALVAWLTRKIDGTGALSGAAVAFVLLSGIGWMGLAMLGGFFLAGTLASVWKLHEKQQMGVAEKNASRRGVANVLGNALFPTAVALLAYLFPAYTFPVETMIAAAFAAATSDTLSSEMGNIYGRQFINILSLQPGKRGADGVVSLEGSLFGLLGAILIALVYGCFRSFSPAFFIIVLSGLAGNLSDSLLGASLQRKGWLNNHTVNFLNTLIAGLLAGAGVYFFI